MEQLDPVNQIEKRYWDINEMSYCWKALRLLAKDRMHYFQDFSATGSAGTTVFKTLNEYIEHALRKLVRQTFRDHTYPPGCRCG